MCNLHKEGAKNMLRKILQQSKSWNDYADKKITLDENQFYREGFPKCVYNDNSLLFFKLILNNGNIIEKAYVDLSQQYMAEGKQWMNAIDGNLISKDRVVAWKEAMD